MSQVKKQMLKFTAQSTKSTLHCGIQYAAGVPDVTRIENLHSKYCRNSERSMVVFCCEYRQWCVSVYSHLQAVLQVHSSLSLGQYLTPIACERMISIGRNVPSHTSGCSWSVLAGIAPPRTLCPCQVPSESRLWERQKMPAWSCLPGCHSFEGASAVYLNARSYCQLHPNPPYPFSHPHPAAKPSWTTWQPKCLEMRGKTLKRQSQERGQITKAKKLETREISLELGGRADTENTEVY